MIYSGQFETHVMNVSTYVRTQSFWSDCVNGRAVPIVSSPGLQCQFD